MDDFFFDMFERLDFMGWAVDGLVLAIGLVCVAIIVKIIRG